MNLLLKKSVVKHEHPVHYLISNNAVGGSVPVEISQIQSAQLWLITEVHNIIILTINQLFHNPTRCFVMFAYELAELQIAGLRVCWIN